MNAPVGTSVDLPPGGRADPSAGRPVPLPPRTPDGVPRAAAVMSAAIVVSRALGFVRVLAIAAVLGTTYLGNTFQASNSVSNVLFELLAAGALSAVLVPSFVELLDAGRNADAEALAGRLLGLAFVVLGVVSVAGIVAAPALARALTSGAGNPLVAARERTLATFLLRFFVPQVVLYALGAVAIAVLQARRRFAVTALAPIGNTVVMLAALAAVRLLHGPAAPGLSLPLAERLALAAGGTLGVAAFVGVPTIALRRGGFHLRPRWRPADPDLRRLLRLSTWGVLQHAGTGALLAAALVIGNGVAGGVVAYQVAFVFFLVPYAVVAQPIHTAILPEFSVDVARGELGELGRSVRWGLQAIALVVVPASVFMVALAGPLMRVLAFGHAGASGARLIAGGLAGLAVGLFPYGAFLLLSRAYYAMGDSRTPAIASLGSAAAGAALMVLVSTRFHGVARIAAMGGAHSAAYLLASAALAIGVARRSRVRVLPPTLGRVVASSVVIALAARALVAVLAPSGRIGTAVAVAGVGAAGALAYLATMRGHLRGRLWTGGGGAPP